MQYILRDPTWSPSNIDFVVSEKEYKAFVDAFCHLVDGKCTASFEDWWTDENFREGHCQRVTYIHQGVEAYADICQSRHNTPLFLVSFSFSTISMNFLGADILGVAYPDLTLQSKALLHPEYTLNDQAQKGIEHYSEERGVEHIICDIDYKHDLQHSNSRSWRYFGDSKSLMVPIFNLNNLLPLSSFGSKITWILGNDDCFDCGYIGFNYQIDESFIE